MKKFITPILLLSLLIGCNASQEDLSIAYKDGYEVGFRQGYTAMVNPSLSAPLTSPPDRFSPSKLEYKEQLYHEWWRGCMAGDTDGLNKGLLDRK